MKPLAIAVAFLLWTTGLHAAPQTYRWVDLCVPGGLHVCFGAIVELTPTEAGTTTIRIGLQNAQRDGSSLPWAFIGLNIFNLQTDNLGYSQNTPSPTLTGSTSIHVNRGVPGGCLRDDVTCASAEWDGNGGGIVRVDDFAYGFPVVGCTVPTLPAGSTSWGYRGHVQTCGDGWAFYEWSLRGTWAVGEATTFHAFGYADGQAIGCEIGKDCVPATVTPEPLTVVLLGSGLAGVAAAYRRRQKRQP